MRMLVLAVACISAAARADVHYGGALGGRLTDLDGQVRSDARAKLAVAGVLAYDVAPAWQVVAEPGLRGSGSGKYPLLYASLPVLGRFTVPVSGLRVRASAGVMTSVLLQAQVRIEDDDGPIYEDIDTVRRWELGVVAGVGVERGAWFGELRWSRGLTTIDAQYEALVVVNTELGLWLGWVR